MKAKIRHFLGGIKGAFVVLSTFLLFPLARLFLWHKRIWIVSERENECRDNGFVFFKYMRTHHKKINCYYALKTDSPDNYKISNLGNVIRFGSFKHFAYFCSARYLISSTTQGFCPSYYLTLFRKRVHLWGKYVFLQHGITKDNQTFLYRKVAKIDLFICGARPEYNDIVKNYGYKSNQVVYTGFPRFDTYHNLHVKNQILVMPTWRRNAYDGDFLKSAYFYYWDSFLKSPKLAKCLNDVKMKLYFYIHPVFQNYSSLFKSVNGNIVIADFNSYDVQTLLKESSILITDFSSVAFDFGYMKKPVIYYQFDEAEYFSSHYIKGYFDYRRDGFGPVYNDADSVIKSINSFVDRSFESNKYLKNVDDFFPLSDNYNSKRVYESIIAFKNN